MKLPVALGRSGTRSLYVLGTLGALKGVGLVLFATGIADGIASLATGTNGWQLATAIALSGVLLRALLAWAVPVVAARAADRTRGELQIGLMTAALDGADLPAGSTSVIAAQGLDELDSYFGAVLPALAAAVTVPLVVGARILGADWVSALVIVVTIPLVPVFMALIGLHTRDRVDAASASLARLSDHLVELAHGLPVLVGLGRAEEQAVALDRVSDEYRIRTMHTLRSAFLSSLALELISTISVAVVAVFVGIRLLGGDLTLATGLLVLVLAPECFGPFRDLGAAFHASQDGLSALRRARELIAVPRRSFARTPGAVVGLDRFGVRYPDRSHNAVDGISLRFDTGRITALTGPSGAGKSTILAVMAGTLVPGAVVTGTVSIPKLDAIAYLPQNSRTTASTARGELELYGIGLAPALMQQRVTELLAEFRLTRVALADPAQLSPGELRRLCFARTLLRVDAGASLVLLDEPTAHLDAESARTVESAIERLRRRATVIVASHERSIVNLADVIVPVGALRLERHSDEQHQVEAAETRTTIVAADPKPEARQSAPPSTESGRAILSTLVRPVRWRLLLAVMLGALATLFAMALTAVSAWLIVRAGEHPPIMYLLVAIVGVRFFGIGRASIRYTERLMTHDAVFRVATSLRGRLWRSLASRGPSARKLLQGGSAVDALVIVVDRVRDLIPRAISPLTTGAIVSVAAIVTVGILDPSALGMIAACVIGGAVIAPFAGTVADRRASLTRSEARSRVARLMTSAVGAANDLRANGVGDALTDQFREIVGGVAVSSRRAALARGIGAGLVMAVTGASSVGMLMVAASAPHGVLAPGIIAVLVFIPLTLAEPFIAMVDAAQRASSLRSALRSISAILPLPSNPSRTSFAPGPTSVDDVVLDEVAARWPGADADAFENVSAWAQRGEWIGISGPSGSGKSTLLTVMLGHLQPTHGDYLLGDSRATSIDPEMLRRHVAWCPQDAHIFRSTIRGNLLLGRSRDETPTEAEMADVLHRVGLSRLIEGMPLGIDTSVGSEGTSLSGGERQRLAVARTMLSRADIILLDEPTAHLDASTARDMMNDLRRALDDRIVFVVSHRDEDFHETDVRIRLGAAARRSSVLA
jgi:ATP-binding cassette subfamily C protein CydCD